MIDKIMAEIEERYPIGRGNQERCMVIKRVHSELRGILEKHLALFSDRVKKIKNCAGCCVCAEDRPGMPLCAEGIEED